MKRILTALSAITLSSLCAAGPDSVRDPSELLNSQRSSPTAQLLELQRSGRLASRQEQRLPGPAQSKIYERYINSFGHPIPETYISEEFTE